ncbi:outer membrane protein transport protein [Pseudomonas sp. TUM22785]|uniref:outer membrane protein transport protein n=1 Tax=Pseudomonas sp. TUM22785 TaxID=3019098 RepID=UPI0023052BF5|nr:outer membrane protein transport protein [Pseudomonas sp. TUM22785]WCD83150.1 outer membrane protein transport protein [Pseudomonas sp. TUM22785]
MKTYSKRPSLFNFTCKRSLLSLAVLSAVIGVQQAEAGAFAVPTYGTPGWGRAFAGGSVWKNDPSAAFNNPAAMAFIERPIGQVSAIYADIDMKFKGEAYDYAGNPRSELIDVNGPETRELGDGGNGGFSKWLPTQFLVIPVGDRFAIGLGQVVPMGMRSTWDKNFKAKDFALDTKIETAALAGSLSFKIDDQWAVGGGVVIQRTQGFVSQNVDLMAAAAANPGSIFAGGLPSGVTRATMRVKVDNVSPGWFASVAWKPTAQDTLGLAYHAKIKNELDGDYNWHFSDANGLNFLTSPELMNPDALAQAGYAGLILNPNGDHAESRMDIPAMATFDWVHDFNDSFSLGASVTWTEWSSFKSLKLESHGNLIVDIPYNYKDTWMYSVGGDYRLNDQLTLRAGVALDQTPTRNSTRDARIPDGDRTFVSLGGSYRFASDPNLSVDVAYSRQFVDEGRLRTQNQPRLGGGSVDGKVESKGQIFSVSATYMF